MNRLFSYFVGVVSITILLLVYGCESDPIILNPDGGYVLDVFKTDSSHSYSKQDTSRSIGESSRLYVSNSLNTLIKINSDILSLDSNYCSDEGMDSLLNITVKLIPTDEDIELDTALLSASLILSDYWTEEDISVLLDTSIVNNDLEIDAIDNELSINFGDSDDYLTKLCDENEHYALLLEYAGDDTLEFYSSNHSTQDEKPAFEIDYMDTIETNIDTSKYTINEVTSSSISNFSIDTVTTSEDFGLVSAIFDSLETPTEELLIVKTNQTYGLIDLFEFELDTVFHHLDSRTIEFELENVKFNTVDLNDFAGDNYDPETNSSGTEDNGIYDLGEIFVDCGIDSLCGADEIEDDNYNIDPAGDDYDVETNDTGTEGNGIWDWEELNDNGEFDLGEEREYWQDWGIDGIPDYLEAGNAPEDDFDSTSNPTGSEGNGQYDLGEPFLDTGIDNIWSEEEDGYNPSGTEGNGIYDLGEIFVDCGVDNLCDSVEVFVGGTEIDVALGSYDYSWDGDDVSFEMPQDTSDVDAVLWISSIKTNEDGKLLLKISTLSKLPVLDIEFQLTHTPFSFDSTIWVEQNDELTSIDGKKLIDDISIYSMVEYSDTNRIEINYSNRIDSYIHFPELDNFVAEHLGAEISNADLTFYLDTDSSKLYEDMEILIYRNESEEYLKSFKIEIADLSTSVDLTDYIQECVNGSLNNDTLKLISSDDNNNFSRVVFSTDDTLRYPKLEILYTK